MLRRRYLLLPTAILVVLLFGCAYYNIFYNAKRDYGEAMKQKERSPTHQAPAANLDKCVERCAKVIQLYPDSKWVDDAVMLMGKCFYEKGEYTKALRTFDAVVTHYPRSPFLQEAHYMKGETNLAQGNYAAAILAFETAGALKGELEEQSALRVAESHLLSEDYEDAARAAERFLSKHSETRLKSEALKVLGDALFEKGDLEAAIVQYEQLLRLKPKRKIYFETSLKIGAAYLMLEEVEKALKTLLALRDKALEEEERARLGIWIADCQRTLGQYEEAIKTLADVSQRAPGSEEAQEALYKTGLIYEEDLSDLDAARRSYDRVREMGSFSEYREKALVKSSSIGKLTDYRKTLSGGEQSELARTQFLLAEVYLTDLDNPQRALEEYEKVVSDFPTSEYGPKAAFAVAWLHEKVKGDSTMAITAYYRVIHRYPGTPQATASEEAIARLIPPVNTSDSEPE